MEKKPALAFGFSKTKAKSSIVRAQNNEFETNAARGCDDRELITSIEGKQVRALNEKVEAGPIVIRCLPNNLIQRSASKTTSEAQTAHIRIDENTSQEDAEAIRALYADSLESKQNTETKDHLKIETSANEPNKQAIIVDERIEEADYDKIPIEQFGLAVLRGMGFDEKEGIIGLKNKRKVQMIEPELRPRGLGLGMGSKSLKQRQQDAGTDLIYKKNACIQVTQGRHEHSIGQIVGFDDGLNRILVKLEGSDDKIASILQDNTKLISKSEFNRKRQQTTQ